jgi:hypothetical protein
VTHLADKLTLLQSLREICASVRLRLRAWPAARNADPAVGVVGVASMQGCVPDDKHNMRLVYHVSVSL